MPGIRAAGSLQTCRDILKKAGNKPGPDARCFPEGKASKIVRNIVSDPAVLKDNQDNETGILSLLSNTIIIVRKGKTEKRHYFNSECIFSQASVQKIKTKQHSAEGIIRKKCENCRNQSHSRGNVPNSGSLQNVFQS